MKKITKENTGSIYTKMISINSVLSSLVFSVYFCQVVCIDQSLLLYLENVLKVLQGQSF